MGVEDGVYGSTATNPSPGVHVESDSFSVLETGSAPQVHGSSTASRRKAVGIAVPLLGLVAASGVVALSLQKRAERQFTFEALWERLDEPDELLKYAAQFEPKNGGTYILDDDNFYPLSCAKYDDDTVYPNALCLAGDNHTCQSMPDNYGGIDGVCSEACSEGWGVPCGWEAIADLPAICDGSFEATFPGKSTNRGKHPKNPDSGFWGNELVINSTKEEVWACNVHAFCYSCVDESNVVNDYCKAAVIRTQTLFAPSAVFKYLDSYWCDDDILGDIEDGSFCGLSADKMDLCQGTRSHALYEVITMGGIHAGSK